MDQSAQPRRYQLQDHPPANERVQSISDVIPQVLARYGLEQEPAKVPAQVDSADGSLITQVMGPDSTAEPAELVGV